MPRDRFTASGVTRYALADGGDWVEFRNVLSWGEQMRLAADTSVIGTVAETDEDGVETIRSIARTDLGIYQPRRLAAYLAAWSFVGPDEKTAVALTAASIAALDDETGTELVALLNKHLSEQTLKNAPKSTPA